MADHGLRQSALAHLGLDARGPGPQQAGVRLWLEPPSAKLALRGDAASETFVGAVREILGVAPPRSANTVDTGEHWRVLWLGPDEWLAVSARSDDGDAARALERALAGEHAAVVDVGHGRSVLGLAGEHARDVLAKGCSLDLHPVAFAAGRCAQTALARAHMLLHQVDDAPTYHVHVHRSFADYAFRWLEDAAAEYGLASGAV